MDINSKKIVEKATELEFLAKIKLLDETIWESKVKLDKINRWLEHFENSPIGGMDEKLHALHLLSKFMYFGEYQIKEALRAIYRDLYKYPLVSKIRKSNNDTLNEKFIKREFSKHLESTRFLGMGNPSESGTYLLYYFRQVNNLPRDLFIHGHDIFERNTSGYAIKYPKIKNYIFIDDLCSSGTQAIKYSKGILAELKRKDPSINVQYFTLVALQEGIENIQKEANFDNIQAVFTLDKSFKCFNKESRYFKKIPDNLNRAFAHSTARKYGLKLKPSEPLGFSNNQLLLGFHHNIPDNTLPILSVKSNNKIKWSPIFERIDKR